MEKVIPRGIPTISYVRILNQEQPSQISDIGIDGDFVSVMESGQPTTRHEVAHVFERGISDQEFCEATIGQEAGSTMGASLNPINAFVEDATSAVVFLVGSKFAKKWQFLKRVCLPFVANEFFACISDKEQRDGAEMFQYEALLSAYEIQDEVITDLIRPSIRDLSISVSPDNGVTIQGASKEKIISEDSLRQLFIETCDNRCSHTQPVGGNIDTSTAIWEITLNQKEFDGDTVLYNTSRFIVIDLPALNPLCQSSSEIKILEGHKLHQSLLTFFDCSQKLSSINLASLAPFRSSKLTHYLSELMGGNSLVVALGMLHSGEPQVSRKVLELMNNLTNSRHYPIAGKEMSELVQGLMMKYRSMLINTEDSHRLQLLEQSNSKDLPLNHPAITLLNDRNKELERRLEEAQKQYAEQKINSEQIETDAVRLYEAIQLLKSKYATILEEKKELATELIKREEEKLEMARGLVELKLAHSQSIEKSEKELFEVTSNMLTMKNEIYDMDNSEQLLKAQFAELQEKFNEVSSLYEKERETGITTKTELAEVRQQLEKAETRNVEIGAELVTLLNTKNSLEDQIVVLRKQSADLEESLHADTSDLAALRSENSLLEGKLTELERENEASQRELAEANIQIEKLQIETERNRLQFEQSANDYLREKDQTMKRETQSIMAEVHHLQHEKEQLLVCIRREERRKRDAMRDVSRITEEKEEISKKYDQTQVELNELRATYRKYLGEILEEQSPSATSRAISSSHGNGMSARSGVSNGDNGEFAWQAIADSYLQREKRLLDEVQTGNGIVKQLSVALRKLFDYYRAALDTIEDNCPQAIPKDILTSESLLLQSVNASGDENSIGNSLSLFSDSQQSDPHAHTLRAKLQEAEGNILAEQERSAAVIAKYRKSLQKTEKELEKKSLECSQLSQKLEILTIAMNDKQHGSDETNDKIESVSRRLEAQMQELKKKEGPNSEMKKQINSLKAQCTLLTEENREMRALLLRGGGGAGAGGGGRGGRGGGNDRNDGGGGGGGGSGNQEKTIEYLESYIKKLEQDSDNALLHQLREVESRNSSLISRNSGMEEELRSYKLYMREAIVQYKRQIQDLQNQLTAFQIADFDSNLKEKNRQQQQQQQQQLPQQQQSSNQKNQNETRFPEIPRLKSAT